MRDRYINEWNRLNPVLKEEFARQADQCLMDIRERGWTIEVRPDYWGDVLIGHAVYVQFEVNGLKYTERLTNPVQPWAIMQAHRSAVARWIEAENANGRQVCTSLFKSSDAERPLADFYSHVHPNRYLVSNGAYLPIQHDVATPYQHGDHDSDVLDGLPYPELAKQGHARNTPKARRNYSLD